MVFPLFIQLKLVDNNLQIKLFNKIIFNESIVETFKEIDDISKNGIDDYMIKKDDLIYLKILKKFKVKKFVFTLGNKDIPKEKYSIFYGTFLIFESFINHYFKNAYYLKNNREKFLFKIECIIVSNLGKIIIEYLKLRSEKIRYERASNSRIT